MSKRIVVIAGPNGAGKTTFAREFLPKEAEITTFINVDLYAAAMSPFDPSKAAVRAGRFMIEEMRRIARTGQSFAFETTLAGRNYASLIPRWRGDGYHVKLVFLRLPNAELAISRVRSRVAQGGHNVADAVIRRRFDAGLRNFHGTYRPLVDQWLMYDGSGPVPVLLESGGK